MFPIGSTRKVDHFPAITILLILVNIGIFLMRGPSPVPTLDNLTHEFFHCDLWGRSLTEYLPFTVNYLFTHNTVLHLLVNMIFLAVFGNLVEAHFGGIRFLAFYLLVGVVGELINLLIAMGTLECIFPVGATASITGLIAASLILYPATSIRTWLLFRVIQLPKLAVLILYLVLWTFTRLDSSYVLLFSTTGWWLPIFGFVAGFVFTWLSTIFKPAPPLEHM